MLFRCSVQCVFCTEHTHTHTHTQTNKQTNKQHRAALATPGQEARLCDRSTAGVRERWRGAGGRRRRRSTQVLAGARLATLHVSGPLHSHSLSSPPPCPRRRRSNGARSPWTPQHPPATRHPRVVAAVTASTQHPAPTATPSLPRPTGPAPGCPAPPGQPAATPDAARPALEQCNLEGSRTGT